MSDAKYSGHTAEEVIELMGMLAAQHDVHSADETLAIVRRGYALIKDQQSRLDEAREHLQRERDRADSEAQRAEAYKLRIATLDESIAGCARKVQAVAAERDALKVALEVIAKQALAADMPAIGVDPAEADYKAGYIGCVETARNALAVAEPEVNSKSRLKRVAMQRAARESDAGVERQEPESTG